MSFLKKNFFKKLLSSFLIIFLLFFIFFLIKKGTTVSLPDLNQPISFYSSQTNHDLKLTYIEAIQKAKKKIIISIFTLKDPHLISWLNKKAKQGLEICIYFDKKHNQELIEKLDVAIKKIPYQKTGLMHRKLLLIDDCITILGSANFTKNSLWEDDNLVCGIYSEELTSWMERHLTHYNISEGFNCSGIQFECFLTPDKKRSGLEKLIQSIDSAEKKIQIAMYSFTHPEIYKALGRAKNKGIKVEIFLDKQMKYQNTLKKNSYYPQLKSSFYFHSKPLLLHHKCALIDEKMFIMGSTNWTLAGFLKNQDFIIFFENLSSEQINFLKSIFKKLKISADT